MTTNETTPVSAPRRPSVARRAALLASAAVLGSAVVLGGPVLYHGMVPGASGNAYAAEHSAQSNEHPAQSSEQPAGFADIVTKVKPAVISVRVKLDESEDSGFNNSSNNSEMPFPPGSPMERFFRQFGFPNNGQQGQQRHHFVTGQGSGFFISADGYAVTNNHVVDHAKSVEVTTDEGKTYTAKVIGRDAKTDLALIKVEGHDNFPFVKFAGKNPRVGDWVIAV
jgi:serine protease Do